MLNKKTQGFTLIELLIVIAIIGILAAVLVPNLLSARNRANDTAAQATLSEAITQQEIYQIDTNTYGTTAQVTAADYLGAVDAKYNFAVVDADATGYCMSTQHDGGTASVIFFATASGGLERSQGGNPAVCTVAN